MSVQITQVGIWNKIIYTLITELQLQSVGSVILKLTWTLRAEKWSTMGPELTLLKLREYTFFKSLQILTKPHCVKTSYFFRCEIPQNNAFDYI